MSLLTFVDCGILIKQKLSIPNTGSLKSCYSVHHTHTHTHTHTAETENKLIRISDSEKCGQTQNPEPVTAHLHFQGHKVFPQKVFHSFC